MHPGVAILERCVASLDWLAAQRGYRSDLPQHLQTGERGEEAAFFFLRHNGFVVVARRWRFGQVPGDLDLIAWDGNILCFVEVKTRTSKDLATASSAVDREKRRTLRRLARHYLRQLPEPEEANTQPPTRFDIITIYELPGQPLEITLIPAAFGWVEQE